MINAAPERPWTASYEDGVPAEIVVPDEPMNAALERAAQAYPARIALDFMGSVTTYFDLKHQIDIAAQGLLDLGIQPGDRVAIVLPNCATHVVAVYAVLRIGAVVVEHNPTYTAKALEHQLADSGAIVAICWEKAIAPLLEARPATALRTVIAVNLAGDLPAIKRLGLKLPISSVRAQRAALRSRVPAGVGVLRWERVMRGVRPISPDHPYPASEDLALLQYTGGTTGTPKGAVLRHRHLVANAAQGQAWTQHGDAEETVVAALPFFHSFGLLLCLVYAVRIAATIVIFPKFDADAVLTSQTRRPATFLPGVPPMFERLARVAKERDADLSALKRCISGAMALSAETAQAWEEVTGGVLVEGYGMTESSPVALGNPFSGARRPGTLGLPFPSTDMRVVDPDDPTVLVGPGERGELLVAGPQVCDGYWGESDETESLLVEIEGRTWLRTGDIVVIEDGGWVRLLDRIKEIIVTGGFNVYPSQIEDHIRQMPGIADVAVVGIPGGDLGEKVVAAIVMAEGATRVELAAVRAWSENVLARYALPREIVILPDLPRSQIGKVLRRVVRENLQRSEPQAG